MKFLKSIGYIVLGVLIVIFSVSGALLILFPDTSIVGEIGMATMGLIIIAVGVISMIEDNTKFDY